MKLTKWNGENLNLLSYYQKKKKFKMNLKDFVFSSKYKKLRIYLTILQKKIFA